MKDGLASTPKLTSFNLHGEMAYMFANTNTYCTSVLIIELSIELVSEIKC